VHEQHDDFGGLLEGHARTFKLLISTSGVSADVFVVSACALGGTEDHCSTSVRRTICRDLPNTPDDSNKLVHDRRAHRQRVTRASRQDSTLIEIHHPNQS